MGFVLGFTSLIVKALFTITPEIFDGAVTPVVVAVAFASAVLGSVLAPLIQLVMNAVADVRLPEPPNFDDFKFPVPRIKRRRKHDILQKGSNFVFINKGHCFNLLVLDRHLDESSMLDSALEKIVESIEDEYEYEY